MSASAVSTTAQPFGETAFEERRTVLSPVRAMLVLWWLAAKRNGGVMFLPVFAGTMGWLVYQQQLYQAVVLWMPTVQGIGYTLAIAGPLTAALACWEAGRGHRRRMDDMLAAVPLPSGWSTFAEWLGVTVWAVGCFLGSAAVALGWTATRATWGGPLLWPIGIAAAGLAVCAAAGLLLGRLWPSRFLPPILAIATGFLIVGPTGIRQLERFTMLSPMGPIDSVVREPLVEVDLRVMVPHLRWLAALALVLLLGVVVRQRGGRLARGLLAAGVVAAVVTASPLLDWRTDEGGEVGPFGYASAALPYEPSCRTETVTVCMHPAYEAILDDAAGSIELILAPIAGVRGLPTRYEQTITGEPSDTVLHFSVWGSYNVGWDLAHQIPQELVIDWAAMAKRIDGQGFGPGWTASQLIVSHWLTSTYQGAAGMNDEPLFFGFAHDGNQSLVPADAVAEGDRFRHCQPHPEFPDSMDCTYDDAAAAPLQGKIDAATERFLALDPAVRRAWLEANWADLRAGNVTLEKMP